MRGNGMVFCHPRMKGDEMSNHFSAAMLKFPGDDPRLDLTDLFLFASPERPDKTVLIFDVNPFMTGADFNPDAVFHLTAVKDGNPHTDFAFSIAFSNPNSARL